MGRALPCAAGVLLVALAAPHAGEAFRPGPGAGPPVARELHRTRSAPPLPDSTELHRTRSAPPLPDSTELHRSARDAQRRFEVIRRRHLPTTAGSGGGPCDDRVGRMCWRHLPGISWFPEAEDSRVEEARDELLAELEAVGRALPGDRWVLGQRVHYLGETGRWEEAGELAARCGAPQTWWCRALEGLTLHVRGLYPDAETAFRDALADMDPGEAGRWADPRVLLDGDGKRFLDDALERGRRAWEEGIQRVWAVSDPLLLVEGNDRLTEHFARHTAVRIRERAHNPHAISWGSDMAELLLRYGWAVGWEKEPRRVGDMSAREGVVGHEHPDSRGHVPSGAILRDPASASGPDWTPGLRYARSGYAPAAAPVFLPMDVTVSVFPRADRFVVVVPYRLPADTTAGTRRGQRPPFEPLAAFADRGVEAGLFLTSTSDRQVHDRRSRGRTEGGLLVEAPAGRYWLSAEVWDPAAGRAGRMRAGVEWDALPADVATLSDLLLVHTGPDPRSLREAVRRLRPDPAVESGAAVVVAWEIGGFGWRPELLDYALSLDDRRSGLLRRAGEWLGIVGRDPPPFLAWSEESPGEPGPSFRTVSVRIPRVDPGRYTLRLELRSQGRATLVSTRTIEVTDPRDVDVPARHF